MFKLESYIGPLIMSYLNKYIKLDEQSFKLSLWGGDATFHNLELQYDILEDLMPLPIGFKSGQVYELKIHIPWTKLTTESVVVTLNTVECVLKIKKNTRTKSSKLETNTDKKLENELNQQTGYWANYLNNILSNITIVVNNLIMKLIEDDIVLSINVKSLEYKLVGRDWCNLPSNQISRGPAVFRLGTISDLTICLDKANESGHISVYEQPLLYRGNLQCRIVTQDNAKPTFKLIKLDIQFTDEISLMISTNQMPLLSRLVQLCLAIYYGNADWSNISGGKYANPAKHQSSSGGGSTSGISTNPTDPSPSNFNQSWASWAWSYVPPLLPSGLDDEEYGESGQESSSDADTLISGVPKEALNRITDCLSIGLFCKAILVTIQKSVTPEVPRRRRSPQKICKLINTRLNNCAMRIIRQDNSFFNCQLAIDTCSMMSDNNSSDQLLELGVCDSNNIQCRFLTPSLFQDSDYSHCDLIGEQIQLVIPASQSYESYHQLTGLGDSGGFYLEYIYFLQTLDCGKADSGDKKNILQEREVEDDNEVNPSVTNDYNTGNNNLFIKDGIRESSFLNIELQQIKIYLNNHSLRNFNLIYSLVDTSSKHPSYFLPITKESLAPSSSPEFSTEEQLARVHEYLALRSNRIKAAHITLVVEPMGLPQLPQAIDNAQLNIDYVPSEPITVDISAVQLQHQLPIHSLALVQFCYWLNSNQRRRKHLTGGLVAKCIHQYTLTLSGLSIAREWIVMKDSLCMKASRILFNQLDWLSSKELQAVPQSLQLITDHSIKVSMQGHQLLGLINCISSWTLDPNQVPTAILYLAIPHCAPSILLNLNLPPLTLLVDLVNPLAIRLQALLSQIPHKQNSPFTLLSIDGGGAHIIFDSNTDQASHLVQFQCSLPRTYQVPYTGRHKISCDIAPIKIVLAYSTLQTLAEYIRLLQILNLTEDSATQVRSQGDGCSTSKTTSMSSPQVDSCLSNQDSSKDLPTNQHPLQYAQATSSTNQNLDDSASSLTNSQSTFSEWSRKYFFVLDKIDINCKLLQRASIYYLPRGAETLTTSHRDLQQFLDVVCNHGSHDDPSLLMTHSYYQLDISQLLLCNSYISESSLLGNDLSEVVLTHQGLPWDVIVEGLALHQHCTPEESNVQPHSILLSLSGLRCCVTANPHCVSPSQWGSLAGISWTAHLDMSRHDVLVLLNHAAHRDALQLVRMICLAGLSRPAKHRSPSAGHCSLVSLASAPTEGNSEFCVSYWIQTTVSSLQVKYALGTTELRLQVEDLTTSLDLQRSSTQFKMKIGSLLLTKSSCEEDQQIIFLGNASASNDMGEAQQLPSTNNLHWMNFTATHRAASNEISTFNISKPIRGGSISSASSNQTPYKSVSTNRLSISCMIEPFHLKLDPLLWYIMIEPPASIDPNHSSQYQPSFTPQAMTSTNESTWCWPAVFLLVKQATIIWDQPIIDCNSSSSQVLQFHWSRIKLTSQCDNPIGRPLITTTSSDTSVTVATIPSNKNMSSLSYGQYQLTCDDLAVLMSPLLSTAITSQYIGMTSSTHQQNPAYEWNTHLYSQDKDKDIVYLIYPVSIQVNLALPVTSREHASDTSSSSDKSNSRNSNSSIFEYGTALEIHVNTPMKVMLDFDWISGLYHHFSNGYGSVDQSTGPCNSSHKDSLECKLHKYLGGAAHVLLTMRQIHLLSNLQLECEIDEPHILIGFQLPYNKHPSSCSQQNNNDLDLFNSCYGDCHVYNMRCRITNNNSSAHPSSDYRLLDTGPTTRDARTGVPQGLLQIRLNQLHKCSIMVGRPIVLSWSIDSSECRDLIGRLSLLFTSKSTTTTTNLANEVAAPTNPEAVSSSCYQLVELHLVNINPIRIQLHNNNNTTTTTDVPSLVEMTCNHLSIKYQSSNDIIHVSLLLMVQSPPITLLYPCMLQMTLYMTHQQKLQIHSDHLQFNFRQLHQLIKDWTSYKEEDNPAPNITKDSTASEYGSSLDSSLDDIRSSRTWVILPNDAANTSSKSDHSPAFRRAAGSYDVVVDFIEDEDGGGRDCGNDDVTTTSPLSMTGEHESYSRSMSWTYVSNTSPRCVTYLAITPIPFLFIDWGEALDQFELQENQQHHLLKLPCRLEYWDPTESKYKMMSMIYLSENEVETQTYHDIQSTTKFQEFKQQAPIFSNHWRILLGNYAHYYRYDELTNELTRSNQQVLVHISPVLLAAATQINSVGHQPIILSGLPRSIFHWLNCIQVDIDRIDLDANLIVAVNHEVQLGVTSSGLHLLLSLWQESLEMGSAQSVLRIYGRSLARLDHWLGRCDGHTTQMKCSRLRIDVCQQLVKTLLLHRRSIAVTVLNALDDRQAMICSTGRGTVMLDFAQSVELPLLDRFHCLSFPTTAPEIDAMCIEYPHRGFCADFIASVDNNHCFIVGCRQGDERGSSRFVVIGNCIVLCYWSIENYQWSVRINNQEMKGPAAASTYNLSVSNAIHSASVEFADSAADNSIDIGLVDALTCRTYSGSIRLKTAGTTTHQQQLSLQQMSSNEKPSSNDNFSPIIIVAFDWFGINSSNGIKEKFLMISLSPVVIFHNRMMRDINVKCDPPGNVLSVPSNGSVPHYFYANAIKSSACSDIDQSQMIINAYEFSDDQSDDSLTNSLLQQPIELHCEQLYQLANTNHKAMQYDSIQHRLSRYLIGPPQCPLAVAVNISPWLIFRVRDLHWRTLDVILMIDDETYIITQSEGLAPPYTENPIKIGLVMDHSVLWSDPVDIPSCLTPDQSSSDPTNQQLISKSFTNICVNISRLIANNLVEIYPLKLSYSHEQNVDYITIDMEVVQISCIDPDIELSVQRVNISNFVTTSASYLWLDNLPIVPLRPQHQQVTHLDNICAVNAENADQLHALVIFDASGMQQRRNYALIPLLSTGLWYFSFPQPQNRSHRHDPCYVCDVTMTTSTSSWSVSIDISRDNSAHMNHLSPTFTLHNQSDWEILFIEAIPNHLGSGDLNQYRLASIHSLVGHSCISIRPALQMVQINSQSASSKDWLDNSSDEGVALFRFALSLRGSTSPASTCQLLSFNVSSNQPVVLPHQSTLSLHVICQNCPSNGSNAADSAAANIYLVPSSLASSVPPSLPLTVPIDSSYQDKTSQVVGDNTTFPQSLSMLKFSLDRLQLVWMVPSWDGDSQELTHRSSCDLDEQPLAVLTISRLDLEKSHKTNSAETSYLLAIGQLQLDNPLTACSLVGSQRSGSQLFEYSVVAYSHACESGANTPVWMELQADLSRTGVGGRPIVGLDVRVDLEHQLELYLEQNYLLGVVWRELAELVSAWEGGQIRTQGPGNNACTGEGLARHALVTVRRIHVQPIKCVLSVRAQLWHARVAIDYSHIQFPSYLVTDMLLLLVLSNDTASDISAVLLQCFQVIYMSTTRCGTSSSSTSSLANTLLSSNQCKLLVGYSAASLLGSTQLLGNPMAFMRYLRLAITKLLCQVPSNRSLIDFCKYTSAGVVSSVTALANTISQNTDPLVKYDDYLLHRRHRFRQNINNRNRFMIREALENFALGLLGAIGGLVERPIQELMRPSDSSKLVGVLHQFLSACVSLIATPFSSSAEMLAQTGTFFLQCTGAIPMRITAHIHDDLARELVSHQPPTSSVFCCSTFSIDSHAFLTTSPDHQRLNLSDYHIFLHADHTGPSFSIQLSHLQSFLKAPTTISPLEILPRSHTSTPTTDISYQTPQPPPTQHITSTTQPAPPDTLVTDLRTWQIDTQQLFTLLIYTLQLLNIDFSLSSHPNTIIQ